jgi:tellurite resistance protein TerC
MCFSLKVALFVSSIASPAIWTLFAAIVVVLLALDLLVFHRKPHAIGMREALFSSIFWIAIALAFNAFVYLHFGRQRGLEFFTGYLIEKALAIDNLFVFTVIFAYFAIDSRFQHRILFWGIIGALFFRFAFIFLGVALLDYLHWVSYIFGAFLLITGINLVRSHEPPHPESNPIFRALRKIIPVSDVQTGRFFVRENARLLATPLLLALVLIEISDVIFAVDSIPAVLAVTTDPFIVFSSNVFAILGLRALYSLLANFVVRLRYLRYGLAAVLVFVGAKMLVASFYEVPILWSLAVIVLLLAATAILSLAAPGPSPPPTQNTKPRP